jgi:hypothetical protein
MSTPGAAPARPPSVSGRPAAATPPTYTPLATAVPRPGGGSGPVVTGNAEVDRSIAEFYRLRDQLTQQGKTA